MFQDRKEASVPELRGHQGEVTDRHVDGMESHIFSVAQYRGPSLDSVCGF